MLTDSALQADRATFEPVRQHPQLAALAAEFLWFGASGASPAQFLSVSLPKLSAALGGDYVALAKALEGRWTSLADAGVTQTLPVDLLADVLDRDAPQTQQRWSAVPMANHEGTAEVLALHLADAASLREAESALRALAPIVHRALKAARLQESSRRRIGHLESILAMASLWDKATEVEALLEEMAQAATRLLAADRASIFLWDRPNKILVGRPALGVEGGELRISDTTGVVGQVVQTGEVRSVESTLQPDLIDHQVDRQLGYRTRNLLCVPLRSASGERLGAFEVLNKRSGRFDDEDRAALVDLAALAAVAIDGAQDRQQLLLANRRIADQAAQRVRMIGESPAIEAMRSMVSRVADTELTVLILGENGTGKEVVAQSIHYLSRRREKPFVAVNCAAIPETLLESELFGHEKGAFTDARDARQGKFELARGGTLFLDEIGDLSLGGQAKLLRVLEEKVLVRVGGSVSIFTDARVVAATNQNLEEMVRQKGFRQDLFFRLNMVTLAIPPLRDREADILLLAEHFLAEFSRKARRKPPQLTAAAKKRLQAHDWPGNVRELRNLMERLAFLTPGDRIEPEDLALGAGSQREPSWVSNFALTLSGATDEFQAEYIRRAISHAKGNMTQAATALGLHRSNLYRKMRQLGMQVEE